jgi:Ca-activated chloride channel family protein
MLAVFAAILAAACASSQSELLEDGNEAFVQGDFDEALESYHKAEVDAPDEPEPYYNAGNSLIRRQENEDAARHLQQALKTADPELAVDAAFNLGNAHFELGDFDAAAEAYIESLRLDPGAPDAKHNLELALQRGQEQGSTDPQDEEGEQSDPQEGEEEEDSTDGQDSEESDEQDPSDPSEQNEALTEAQARQLLDALMQDSEALQQHLQFNDGDPSRPAQDW